MNCAPLAIIAVASLASCNGPATRPPDDATNDTPGNVAAAAAATPVPGPVASPVAAPGTSPVPTDSFGLARTRWSVTAINGRAVPGGPGYYLAFDKWDKGGITAGFGCNSFQGRYSLNGDHLTTTDLHGTEMACGAPAMMFEREGAAVLSSNARVEQISGDRITLVGETGTISLRRAP